ncbi:Uncharacterised protein [Klebsiella pneumoniae]|nr:Uncharacterised protein [Klebsiella pneumoniae]
MHIQTQPVAQAMHKVRAVGVVGDKLVNLAFQDPQPHQAGNHNAHHFLVNLTDRGARPIEFQRGLQRFEHNVVDLALRRGKFTVYREGAGNVPGIAAILAAGVNQD